MLSHADANLVRRDRDLTGLATLLDTDAFIPFLNNNALLWR